MIYWTSRLDKATTSATSVSESLSREAQSSLRPQIPSAHFIDICKYCRWKYDKSSWASIDPSREDLLRWENEAWISSVGSVQIGSEWYDHYDRFARTISINRYHAWLEIIFDTVYSLESVFEPTATTAYKKLPTKGYNRPNTPGATLWENWVVGLGTSGEVSTRAVFCEPSKKIPHITRDIRYACHISWIKKPFQTRAVDSALSRDRVSKENVESIFSDKKQTSAVACGSRLRSRLKNMNESPQIWAALSQLYGQPPQRDWAHFQHFSRSTRFAYVCATHTPEFQQKLRSSGEPTFETSTMPKLCSLVLCRNMQ
jgi:hypothetical protein